MAENTIEQNKEFAETEAPVKPPRPLSPFAQAHLTLSEAFPTIESNVVRAVLIGAQGKTEHAFNGLLSLTDPTYEVDESAFEDAQVLPPPPPPRQQQQQVRRQPRTQMEEDERLARMLAEEERGGPSTQRQSQQQQGEYVDDRSFFEDDLPQIKADFTKGFNETKDKVNSWFENFRKKIDSPEPVVGNQRGQSGGGRKYYDGEPDEIDFKGIQLNNNDQEEARPAMPARPGDDEDLYTPRRAGASKKLVSNNSSVDKIPLKSSTVGAAEEDPFLISDSEEEGEPTKSTKTKTEATETTEETETSKTKTEK